MSGLVLVKSSRIWYLRTLIEQRDANRSTRPRAQKTTMKKDIHPAYHDINITMTDGSTHVFRSTMGKPGDSMRLDIDYKSHAAWTGAQNNTFRAGRLDSFNKKFAGFGMPTGPKEKSAEGTK